MMGERCTEDALIGANLKKFREVFQIKRKELAEIFHISEDGVYRIERGETYCQVLMHIFWQKNCIVI